jgi:hypothetical protein
MAEMATLLQIVTAKGVASVGSMASQAPCKFRTAASIGEFAGQPVRPNRQIALLRAS